MKLIVDHLFKLMENPLTNKKQILYELLELEKKIKQLEICLKNNKDENEYECCDFDWDELLDIVDNKVGVNE